MTWRFDIQFLRGVAVLLVVGYHAFPELGSHGYLGVDLFFVISGFLITSIILRGLEREEFSFVAFYIRRARRILPGSFATLVGATILAYFILTAYEWSLYLQQLLGALTFTANFVLAEQSGGYFGPLYYTVPLLHMWSLAVEEQFYLTAPLLLWVVPARARLPLLVMGTFTSFFLCVWLLSLQPFPFISSIPEVREKIAFFMLPPRAWELMIGAICAWIMLRCPGLAVAVPLKYFALALVIAVSLLGMDPVHPRGDALVVTLGAAVMLLGRSDWLSRSVMTRSVAAVGDWSYSLYLVHWPLFSFAHIAYASTPPLLLRLWLVALSLLLAWLQYRFIEQRFREGGRATGRQVVLWTTAMLALLSMAAAPAAYRRISRGDSNPAEALAGNVGLDRKCDQNGAVWLDLPSCRTSDDPTIAIWGDSFAMHLVEGLRASGLPIIQMTQSACAPVLGATPIVEDSPVSPESCQSFTDSAFAAILQSKSIRVVVISGYFSEILAPGSRRLLVAGEARNWSPDGVVGFEASLGALKRAGKTPVLVAPIPTAEFDPSGCNIRQLEGLPIGGRSTCSIAMTETTPQYRAAVEALRGIARRSGTLLLDPADVLCSEGVCRTRDGSDLIYRDPVHLTYWGSRYLIGRLGILQHLGASALPARNPNVDSLRHPGSLPPYDP